MTRVAAELRFGYLSGYNFSGGDAYSSTGLGLGLAMMQNSGVNPTDYWAGPTPISIIRPVEYSAAIPVQYPSPLNWSKNIDWIFFADAAAAAATRRILKATYNRQNGNFSIDGFITLNLLSQLTHTVRAFKMTYDTYTSGTVGGAINQNYISGWGMNFSGDGICSGNRIGFGTTIPSNVTTWYTISGYGGQFSDTGLYLNTTLAAPVTSGAYVIEDLRAIMVTTNGTAAAGGVFLVKGLNVGMFTPAGTTISSGISGDNQSAVYRLGDSITQTNTAAFGCGLEAKTSTTGQNLWVLDTLANPKMYCYNIRKSLLVSGGLDISSVKSVTAAGGAVAGTTSQVNNGIVATAAHGPGNGLKCIYFTTTTRVYRTVDLSTIASGSSSWIADNMTEVPAGGTSTFAASALMNTIEYSPNIDKFIISVNATTTPFKSYITKYKTDASQFDRNWGIDNRQIDQSAADGSITPVVTTASSPYTVNANSGISYVATIGTTAITNRVYATPLEADWEYATSSNACIVTPAILTPNCSKYIRLYVNEVKVVGGATTTNLGMTTEPYRVYYRTAGIDNNSGGWNLLTDYHDLSGVASATKIQFRFEFRTIGTVGVPARLLSLNVVYEDNSTLSNYQPSVAQSNITNKQFAWRFATGFGTAVPTLRIQLYDAVSNSLLVDDQTTGSTGTFEKSTDGGSNWTAYNTTDKVNETTYIRYTPASLGDNIKVLALLTLY